MGQNPKKLFQISVDGFWDLFSPLFLKINSRKWYSMSSTEIGIWLARFKAFIPKSILCLREGYSLAILRKDLTAGIAVGVLAFPLAMAYAIGANIPPEKGLYTAIIAGFLISLLGGSRVQIGGPTGTFILLLYTLISTRGFESMVIATLMAGVILIAFGLLGVGTYIKYIPYPVVTGLTTGIALTIFTSQIKDFFGLSITQMPIDVIGKWKIYFYHFSTTNFMALLIGLGTLGTIIFFRKFRPQFPGAIFALALACFITWVFNIDIATIGSHYGALPRTLPIPSVPHFNIDQLITLFPDAMTIALLIAIESLLAGVVSEGMTGWRHQANCELVAQGIANIGSVICGGIPAAGALARTAANVKYGAHTPISGMIHALIIFLIMYIFAPLAGKIPLTALAAVLFMIAWSMSELHHFFHLFTAPRRDILVLITVFILTVLLGVTAAVQVGMILAAFLFMKQMSDITDVISPAQLFEDHREDAREPDAIKKQEVPPEVEIYEINGPFFFGVADRLKNLLNGLEHPPKIFILRMRKVPTIDASGMHALEEFFYECQRQKTLLLLSGVKRGVLRDLKRFHLDLLIGEERIFFHINSALAYCRAQIGSSSLPQFKSSAQAQQAYQTPPQ